jgi:hypothetical protein
MLHICRANTTALLPYEQTSSATNLKDPFNRFNTTTTKQQVLYITFVPK